MRKFLLLPQCFLPIWRRFCHCYLIQNCCLQTFSLEKSKIWCMGKGYRVDPLPDDKFQTLPNWKSDDNSKFEENGSKLSKWVENTVGKGEIARYVQFLLFPQCFQKASFPGASKVSLCGNGLREELKLFIYPYLYSISIYQKLGHAFYDNLKEEPAVIEELRDHNLVSIGRSEYHGQTFGQFFMDCLLFTALGYVFRSKYVLQNIHRHSSNLYQITKSWLWTNWEATNLMLHTQILCSVYPFPNKPWVLHVSLLKACQPFESTEGKGEIARNEHFLLFPQCFLPIQQTFCHLHQIWHCCLQTLFNLEKSENLSSGNGWSDILPFSW